MKHGIQSKQTYKQILRLQSSSLPANHPNHIYRNLAKLPPILSDVLAKNMKDFKKFLN